MGVVGVGCCVLDELLLVDRYPVVGAETAIRVKEYSLQGGGPAGIPTRREVFDFLAGRGVGVQDGNQNPDCR